MSRTRIGALLVVGCLGTLPPALAADFVIDNGAGCVAVGGEWTSPTSCLVHHLVVEAGDTLVVANGFQLVTAGTAFNYGLIETLGSFQPIGPFNNRGTLVTRGLTVTYDTITNTGTYVNRGYLHTESGGIDNYAVFENAGFFETCGASFINRAYMHNARDAYIDNWCPFAKNEGILVNDGSFFLPDSDYYRFENAGAFENTGIVDNGTAADPAMFFNTCGAAFYGPGRLSGGPLVYLDCQPAAAIQLLMSRVLDAGSPPAFALSKEDARKLAGYLATAAKDVTLFNDRASAMGEVRAFIDVVIGLRDSGKLLPYLGTAFIGWAERIDTLLSF